MSEDKQTDKFKKKEKNSPQKQCSNDLPLWRFKVIYSFYQTATHQSCEAKSSTVCAQISTNLACLK